MAVDCRDVTRRVQEIRRNRRSQSPDDLVEVAEALGFEVNRKRGKGSHVWLVHPTGVRFAMPTSRNPIRVGTTTAILRQLEVVLDDVCGNRRSSSGSR